MREKLRHKIKVAICEDAKVKSVVKTDPDTQPNRYQLDLFLRKSGYRLVDVIDNQGHPELIIEPSTRDKLHPDISHNIADQAFYIKVEKQGAMLPAEVLDIIKGYQAAVSVVQHLDTLDLHKLEYQESEE